MVYVGGYTLQAAVEKIKGAGATGRWLEGKRIGRAYRFTGPVGHNGKSVDSTGPMAD